MFDYEKTLIQIRRERVTEESVRSMAADEIVDWIHGLEDEVVCFEERIRELEAALDEIANWPNGGNRYGQCNIQKFAKKALEPTR